MSLKFSIVAAEEADQKRLEMLLQETGRAQLAGRPLAIPGFPASETALRPLLAQAPEVVLLHLPLADTEVEAALGLVQWLRQRMPHTVVMVAGPLEPPQLIVRAMRAGATEYLELPLRAAALEEAITRYAAGRQAGGSETVTRGRLIAVLGARGGCGATTVAVNLALALQSLRRGSDPSLLLLDTAPLGHAALHLNLKPHFALPDLLAQSQRLDASMLQSLLTRHPSGLEVLAGPSQPLGEFAGSHAAWMELLLRNFPIVVADLSARLDGLTQAVLEQADRVLFITQTDMVSLWSAAKVRQYLDPGARLRFELVLNRYTATPEVDLPGLETLTHTPLLCKLPNAHALVMEAIERGEPVVRSKPDADLSKSLLDLAGAVLGRPEKKRTRSWLPFFRVREVEG